MATHHEATSEKGSVASVTAPVKTWRHVQEPDPQAAVDFVNLAPAQVAGEVSMANRPDGSVDVYYYL